jgi:hypothetical protein
VLMSTPPCLHGVVLTDAQRTAVTSLVSVYIYIRISVMYRHFSLSGGITAAREKIFEGHCQCINAKTGRTSII